MTNVIAFNAAARTKRPRINQAASGMGAEILFFTGVRYVREDVEAAPQPKKPRAAKRAPGRSRDERRHA